MWRHFVYQHRKADSGEIFYVGKGTVRRRVYERALTKDGRSTRWANTVAKHGFLVEILASCQTDAEAQRLERLTIAEYGRNALVNLTDGGEGSAGVSISASTRRKRSLAARR